MKHLENIVEKVKIEAVSGEENREINKVNFDSRKVSPDDLFVAIRGSQMDGHQFIPKASKAGATTFVCEEFPKFQEKGKTYIKVDNSKKALAQIAANYYNNPSADLTLVGVTGTNGKTTIASLLFQLFSNSGFPTGLLSTVKVNTGKKEQEASLTTPDSLSINHYLNEMRKNDVEYAFMEVSSHGIAQHRTTGLAFDGGIFTNLSHDHLDYHKTFAQYRDVKKSFFDSLPKTAFALTNEDDKNGPVMLQNTAAKKYTYALKNNADYKARIIENELTGLQLNLDGNELWTQLIGKFNAYNLLAIYAAADLLGLSKMENLKNISSLQPVAGRFQHFNSEKDGITVVVDYAHTPDALENVLQTLNEVRKPERQIITVVGCGGDRDASKRTEMAQIAVSLSQKVIFTSDNPRTEDPDRIIEEMEEGVDAIDIIKVTSNRSRFQAIKTACGMANKKDMILIAGKGHETYQEINGERQDFDDLKIAHKLMNQLNK